MSYREDDLDEGFPFRLLEGRFIKALEIEKYRAKQHHHDEEPRIITVRIDRLAQIEPEGAVIAQGMRGQQRERQQERIDQLLDLGV